MATELGIWEESYPGNRASTTKCCKNRNRSNIEKNKGGNPLPAGEVKEGFQEEEEEERE